MIIFLVTASYEEIRQVNKMQKVVTFTSLLSRQKIIETLVRVKFKYNSEGIAQKPLKSLLLTSVGYCSEFKCRLISHRFL